MPVRQRAGRPHHSGFCDNERSSEGMPARQRAGRPHHSGFCDNERSRRFCGRISETAI
jgi:hypothetical protein